jgi:hypothetical protein
MLRRAGVVGSGRVCAVEVLSAVTKLRSHTLRLGLKYEGSVVGAPTSLIMKMGHLRDGRPPYGNRREIGFYRNVASALPDRLAPRCYETADATEAGPWRLLLEDLTDTHFIATEHPLLPALPSVGAQYRHGADCTPRYGTIHARAFFWDVRRMQCGRSILTAPLNGSHVSWIALAKQCRRSGGPSMKGCSIRRFHCWRGSTKVEI